MRFESQGPDRRVKASHWSREAAEHGEVDLEKLEQDAGELSVEKFDIIIANVVPEQSGIVMLPQQRVDATPSDEIHYDVGAQAERVGSHQPPGNDSRDGDFDIAEEAQYLPLGCNLLIGVLIADATDDWHAEQPGGAVAKAQFLAQVVRAVEEVTV